MHKGLQVSVSTDETNQNLAVLRIASASRNSVSQFYSERVQVTAASVDDLNRKVKGKLTLHHIGNIQLNVSIQFQNDKTVTCNSPEDLQGYDFKTDARTQCLTMKWSFVFDAIGDGHDHLHSVYVRVSERLNPALVLQKMMSNHTEDVDSLDGDAFATVSCKVDFIDSRFSNELLAIVTDWVRSLPRAEATFGFVNWLHRQEERMSKLIRATLPALVLLAYIGYWLTKMPTEQTSSVRIAVAWIVGGSFLLYVAQYVSAAFVQIVGKHLRVICTVPVFQITSGDGQRMTSYLAKSQKSLLTLSLTAFVLGFMKVVGIYFASLLFHS